MTEPPYSLAWMGVDLSKANVVSCYTEGKCTEDAKADTSPKKPEVFTSRLGVCYVAGGAINVATESEHAH